VHGGGWMIGDKATPGVVRSKVAHWVPQGIALASVNYRTFPAAEPLQQVDDTRQAIDTLLARAAGLNLDAGAVYLLGHSSGAWLAAMLEARRTRGAEAPWRALVLMDTASYDLVGLMQGPHRPFMDRLFGADPSHWAACSPWHQLQATPRPMLLVCSSARDDATTQAEALRGRVQALGGQAELLTGDWGHAEINRGVGHDKALTAGIDRFLAGQGLALTAGPGVTPPG
jgi:arylformamidase